MSRLTIDLTDKQHQSLKALAALQGKTIKQYALERLFPGHTGGQRSQADPGCQQSPREIVDSANMPPDMSS
ncbi:hypothetical protein [Pannonibacter phragmitetus]|uniref:hypothetical protein n=1 Tax=Pannonibacter phragmitetus TaxID=121719 RepID=UPI001FFC856C|nr:hypothetical protein [Pannonibacter phragmitetus]